MVGWPRRLNGLESEQAPGDGEGQGSLACCSPRGRKESDMTEQLNMRGQDPPLQREKRNLSILLTVRSLRKR